jgi:hypothetical protein
VWSADVHWRTPGEALQPASSETHAHPQSQNGSSSAGAEAVSRSSRRAKKGAASTGSERTPEDALATAVRAPRAAGSSKRIAAVAAPVAASRPSRRGAFVQFFFRFYRKNLLPIIFWLSVCAPLFFSFFFALWWRN